MIVMAVGAHPDDLEILCGGTLSKFSKRGDEVWMVHLCNGNLGGRDISREELARIREQEAIEAGKVIGANVRGGVFNDLEAYVDIPSREKVIDIIREAKPDIILTHSPDDYFSDHFNTGKLVIDALFIAILPNYKTKLPAFEKQVSVYYMDTVAGVNFLPAEYVDVTEHYDAKIEMLKKHKSQHSWVKDHHGSDMFGLIEAMGRFRGVQCGVKYAESFRRYEVWGKITPSRILP